MKMKTLFVPSLLLLLTVFTYLFYQWTVGINVFLFDALLLLLLLRYRPELGRRASFRWAVAGLLPAALSIVVVHSTTGLIAHTAGLLLLIGFAQERELRFVWYGLVLGIFSLFAGPFRLVDRWSVSSASAPQRTSVFRWLRHAVTPLFVAFPFLLLYLIGSEGFNGQLEAFLLGLEHLFANSEVSTSAVLFLLGLVLTLPLFYPADELRLADREGQHSDHLHRQRRRRTRSFPFMALRSQYRRGVITLLLLNGLILLTNLTDLRYIWLDTAAVGPSTLSYYVHVGTNSLLLSVFLAMVVVLRYFRRNLNFYRDNLLLRRLTYLWLAQNAFLTLSVGVRNWHYVSEYGLAYGRIQVAFVLLLILVGLYTLYRKVRHALSLSFLLQTNGLALWLFLIAFGAVNWPGVITRVNLTQARSEIDWDYLIIELDERNLFLLQPEAGHLPTRLSWKIREKVRRAREAQERTDWRGCNYADYRNRAVLEE